jgi:hypothetical protein
MGELGETEREADLSVGDLEDVRDIRLMSRDKEGNQRLKLYDQFLIPWVERIKFGKVYAMPNLAFLYIIPFLLAGCSTIYVWRWLAPPALEPVQIHRDKVSSCFLCRVNDSDTQSFSYPRT